MSVSKPSDSYARKAITVKRARTTASTRERIKEYLKIVSEQEKNIYLQDAAIEQLQKEADFLGQRLHFREPICPNKPEGSIFLIILYVLCIVVFCIFAASGGDTIPALGTIAFVLLILLFIPLFFSIRSVSRYMADEEAYREDLEKFERSVRRDKERVELEFAKKEILLANIQALRAQKKKSKATLSDLYSLNILYPKYRNFIMVSSLYEYFCAGRCSTLTGHEGAYNILESEMRLNLIIFKLDQVVQHLEAIQQNQHMLYSSIQEANRRSSAIIRSVDKLTSAVDTHANKINSQLKEIKEADQVTAYCALQAKRELEYMNRMDYLSGRNDNVFINRPPF